MSISGRVSTAPAIASVACVFVFARRKSVGPMSRVRFMSPSRFVIRVSRFYVAAAVLASSPKRENNDKVNPNCDANLFRPFPVSFRERRAAIAERARELARGRRRDAIALARGWIKGIDPSLSFSPLARATLPSHARAAHFPSNFWQSLYFSLD